MRVFETKDTKLNMCNHCVLEQPTCPKATIIEFGDGVGNDNVTACSEFCGYRNRTAPIELDKSYGIVPKGKNV